MRRVDVLLAFLISPLVTPLTFVVFAALAGNFRGDDLLFNFWLVAPFAYVAALIFGLPALFLYRVMGWRSAGAFALGGALIGHFVAALLPSHPAAVVACALAGGLSALTFRLLLSDYHPRRGEGFK